MLPSTDILASRYGDRRKELLKLVQALVAMGAQAELDLPRIVVIGNQSAGKSSIVEAISGISVPRDAGTCTRCPMECRLSQSDGLWTCKISIRTEFNASNERVDEVKEAAFGDHITDKSLVEPAIRRAQAAVLNPHIPATEFLSMDLNKLGTVGGGKSLLFSRNVVCVDLEGPELTDLSFIDLPGLVQNAEPHIVDLVKDLVNSHIMGNCLILVALPMTDDIDNQLALRLARLADEKGRRTIGVMTKPDMLTAGSTKARQLWLDVIEGRNHRLSLGYFCTRQPDDAERARNISVSKARESEEAFFRTIAPWSTSTARDRFGTKKLTARLSDLLIGVINDTLPGLRNETLKQLEECNQELASLPQAIDMEPTTYMLGLLAEFSSQVNRHVRGGSGCSDLIHENLAAFGDLKVAIRRTAPPFVALTKSALSAIEMSPEEAVKSIDLEAVRDHIKNSITRELPGNVPFESKLDLIVKFQETWKASVDACFDRVRVSTVKVLLTCLDKTFSRYDVLLRRLKNTIGELTKKHVDLCNDYLSATLESEKTPFTQNGHYLSQSIDKWLSIYKEVRASDSEQRPETLQAGRYIPRADGRTGAGTPKSSPFARNMTTGSSMAFGLPQPSSSAAQPKSEKVNAALSALAEMGLTGLTQEDLGKLNPPDEFETELRVMAEVRGYFQVSYKRVIDCIPSLIDLKFVRAIGEDLQPFLIHNLGLGSESGKARLEAYLAEDPNVVARRNELIAKRSRLEMVEQELLNSGL